MNDQKTPVGAGAEVAPPEMQRFAAFLEERIAWLKYEADHGGDWQAIAATQKETAYLLGAIRSGRYRDDGRPSWLLDAIPLAKAEGRS